MQMLLLIWDAQGNYTKLWLHPSDVDLLYKPEGLEPQFSAGPSGLFGRTTNLSMRHHAPPKFGGMASTEPSTSVGGAATHRPTVTYGGR